MTLRKVVLFIARVRKTLLSQFGARTTGAGRAMVTISNVQQRYIAKRLDEAIAVICPPNRVFECHRQP